MSLRIALCTLAAALVSPSPAPAAASGPWTGTPTLIGGTARYDSGEWIYTDFVYDDYGADTVPAGQPNVVSLAPTAGDFRYPNGTTAAGNAADIVEVRARLSGDAVEVRVLLQSIVSSSVPALRVVADGAETIVTERNATVDADANTLTFTVPKPATDELALNIGAGLHDGNGGLRAGTPGYAQANSGAFTTGAPTDARLFDLAFNTHVLEGRGGAWNEVAQSAALARGDLASFTQRIDLEVLASGIGLQQRLEPGYYVRIFRSRQALGEGMAPSFPQYRGAWQPYAIWIPTSYDAATPASLFLNLHSLSVHHNQYRGGAAPSASYKTLYEQYERKLGAIVATPLARGPDGWYKDQALVDTLEVWADVLRHYSIDRERVYVGGYSMGGYGTYRLATLMPDAFASGVSIVGPPSSGIWAYPAPPSGGESSPDFTYRQLENTLHVPLWLTAGAADELVPISGVARQAMRLDELQHEYRFAVHPADHFAFAFADEWSREAAWLASHARRVVDPDEISFKVRPASWATNGDPSILAHLEALVAEVGARLDGAYWIDDVRVADGTDVTDVTGSVQIYSGGFGRQQFGLNGVSTVGTDGPTPHVLTGQDKAWIETPERHELWGQLTNVTALTVDLGRARLSNSPDISSLQVDRPCTVTFVRDGAIVDQVVLGM